MSIGSGNLAALASGPFPGPGIAAIPDAMSGEPLLIPPGRESGASGASRASTVAHGPDMPGMQLTMSPYYGKCDLSALADGRALQFPVDQVSVADLLRNGFVFPPHSILDGVKLVTFNFDPRQDMRDEPTFSYRFRRDPARAMSAASGQDWVDLYHRHLSQAVVDSCKGMQAPWLLQSGGKDSTTLAIAAAEVRPDTTCITYLGGQEENELASASDVATSLGLRHESLVCDPSRAYERYLAILDRMPLLTADFALLSYVDLATEIARNGGDGVVDGLGSDNYFGLSVGWRHRCLSILAKGLRVPGFMHDLPVIRSNFELSYLLATLQMDPVERAFPGSRFTDAEVDGLFGGQVASRSRRRLAIFRNELDSASDIDEWWAMASSIAGSAGAVCKGLYATSALSLDVAYPFCDRRLREWISHEVPPELLMDVLTATNKVLVRQHIATRFTKLPYIARKGSFRFDVRGLARCKYDQVHAFSAQAREVLPGATRWLERNRGRLDNKYHASKFYLLAIVLPWIVARGNNASTVV
jgi:asparagine synthetase B (glutamine-hydrolysing)